MGLRGGHQYTRVGATHNTRSNRSVRDTPDGIDEVARRGLVRVHEPDEQSKPKKGACTRRSVNCVRVCSVCVRAVCVFACGRCVRAVRTVCACGACGGCVNRDGQRR